MLSKVILAFCVDVKICPNEGLFDGNLHIKIAFLQLCCLASSACFRKRF